MAQFVIEFGSATLAPVWAAMMPLVEHPTVLDVSLWSGGGATIPATKDALAAIPGRFADCEIESVTLRTATAGIRYGLVVGPRFNGQDLTMWMGTIEITTNDWRSFWDRLLQFEKLAFVCVGEEEGVELRDQDLTVTSFPWSEWPLLAAALRGDAGRGTDWVIHERATSFHPTE